jgi:hypothetical protein
VQRLFAFSITNLYLAGTAIAAYALLEGVEAAGLWLGRRWAEYLLFAKRLFGLPGGGKAERAEHDADTGWPPIEPATPTPAAPFPATPGNDAAKASR